MTRGTPGAKNKSAGRGASNERSGVHHRNGRYGEAEWRALEDLPADAVPDLDQLYRSRLAVGRDAGHRQGVRHRPGDAGADPELVLLDLRADAGAGRHARRPLQAAHRDRPCDIVLGLLPGAGGAVHQLDAAAHDPARARRVGSADLSGGRQAQRDLDDADRTRPRRDLARRRRSAWRCARLDRDRLADGGVQLLACRLRRRRHRHHAVRAVGLVLHPQRAARASLGQ